MAYELSKAVHLLMATVKRKCNETLIFWGVGSLRRQTVSQVAPYSQAS